MADLKARSPSGDLVKLSDSKTICFVLDDSAFNSVVSLLADQNISFYIEVHTKSGKRYYEKFESFLAWVNKPHAAIQSILLATPDSFDFCSVYICFENGTEVPAVMWGLYGPEKPMLEIKENLELISKKIKRPYSFIFAGGFVTDIVNVCCLLSIVMLGTFCFFWIIDEFARTTDYSPQKFMLPNGHTVELVPLKPILDKPKSSLGQIVLPYLIIFFITCMLIKLLRPVFPVGMFEIGFDCGYERRRAGTQNSVFWGGIMCFIIAIAALMLWNYLSR